MYEVFKIFTIEYIISLIIIGILAGFLSGLLGIGGGFLFVPFQYFLLQSAGIDDSIAILIAFGTSLAIIVPTAFTGAYRHSKNTEGIIKPGAKFGIFGILGGFIGGLAASMAEYVVLEKAFGIFLLIIAIYDLITLNKSFNFNFKLNNYLTIIIGLIIGFLSGLLGIGGGIFLIVILNLLLGYSMKKSIGISSIFICFTAIGGMASYILTGLDVNILPYSIGYINLIHLFVICLFSIPFAYMGAKISDKVDDKKLKLVFLIAILYISLKMIGILP
ncbi:sulfite exporter TauE/SafE family protein [Methanobrevibacter sp. DSM 116169]|uniref:sulfite exporter TauE/SafE family protein n=1 Tax=Methanobrevibacter sp. DSM 116169 TaxID=3242727 RepID=UPI0038FCD665